MTRIRTSIFLAVAIICSVIVIFLAQESHAKYVFEWDSGYTQVDVLKFYFGSNYLVSGQGDYPIYEYAVDDISNATVYFEIYNYADGLKVSEVAVEEINFTVEAYTLEDSKSVWDDGGTIRYADEDGNYDKEELVWIQDESDERRYKAMVEVVVPESRFEDGRMPTVQVIVTATDPYAVEIGALFELHTNINQNAVRISKKEYAIDLGFIENGTVTGNQLITVEEAIEGFQVQIIVNEDTANAALSLRVQEKLDSGLYQIIELVTVRDEAITYSDTSGEFILTAIGDDTDCKKVYTLMFTEEVEVGDTYRIVVCPSGQLDTYQSYLHFVIIDE